MPRWENVTPVDLFKTRNQTGASLTEAIDPLLTMSALPPKADIDH
jgi:hypothetical protein